MESKQEIIDDILRTEGGYVNDPADSGGETHWGITESRARQSGYNGDMRTMPRSVAEQIYAEDYWDAVRGTSMAALSPAIAEEVVDTGVNMGPHRAVRFLQRALNVLNVGGELYADLVVDGKAGPATLAALEAYLAVRSEAVLLTALNCLQGAAYIELAERREKDQRFVYGWIKQRVSI